MGCRSFGQEHIKASIKAGLDVCIMERNDEIREMCKNKFSVKEAYSDINRSLESDADIVDIVLPTHIHKEVSIKAMKKDKHVITQYFSFSPTPKIGMHQNLIISRIQITKKFLKMCIIHLHTLILLSIQRESLPTQLLLDFPQSSPRSVRRGTAVCPLSYRYICKELN